MLILKRTSDDDYDVREKDRYVERACRANGISDGSAQFWGNSRVPNVPGLDRGFAITREEAMAAFKQSWTETRAIPT
jgi:hypothetical protein